MNSKIEKKLMQIEKLQCEIEDKTNKLQVLQEEVLMLQGLEITGVINEVGLSYEDAKSFLLSLKEKKQNEQTI